MQYHCLLPVSCLLTAAKCSPGIPCDQCVSKEADCTANPLDDGRRARKRLVKDLSTRADGLETLFLLVRSSDDDSLQDLLQLVRAQRPVEELVEAAELALRRKDLRRKSRQRLRLAVLSITSLTDQPIIRVPASPWTSAVVDDHAISHLVSIYFTWHGCAYPAMDQDVFVHAMNSKDLSSQFCSPLLVNAICWCACVSVASRCVLQYAVASHSTLITPHPLKIQMILRQEESISGKRQRVYRISKTTGHVLLLYKPARP